MTVTIWLSWTLKRKWKKLTSTTDLILSKDAVIIWDGIIIKVLLFHQEFDLDRIEHIVDVHWPVTEQIIIIIIIVIINNYQKQPSELITIKINQQILFLLLFYSIVSCILQTVYICHNPSFKNFNIRGPTLFKTANVDFMVLISNFLFKEPNNTEILVQHIKPVKQIQGFLKKYFAGQINAFSRLKRLDIRVLVSTCHKYRSAHIPLAEEHPPHL